MYKLKTMQIFWLFNGKLDRFLNNRSYIKRDEMKQISKLHRYNFKEKFPLPLGTQFWAKFFHKKNIKYLEKMSTKWEIEWWTNFIRLYQIYIVLASFSTKFISFTYFFSPDFSISNIYFSLWKSSPSFEDT
jgi:hypothetical protein